MPNQTALMRQDEPGRSNSSHQQLSSTWTQQSATAAELDIKVWHQEQIPVFCEMLLVLLLRL